jgi:hypothetical protein
MEVNMTKKVYAIDIKNVLVNSLVGIVLGITLSVIPMSSLISVIIALVGIWMIVANGFRAYFEIVHNDHSTNELIVDLLGILLGFALLFSGNLVVMIIVAIYLIIQPIIYLALTRFNKDELLVQLPKIVLGIVLLVSGLSTFDVLFKVIGIILLVGSIIYLVVNYYLYKKSGVKIVK